MMCRGGENAENIPFGLILNMGFGLVMGGGKFFIFILICVYRLETGFLSFWNVRFWPVMGGTKIKSTKMRRLPGIGTRFDKNAPIDEKSIQKNAKN